MAEQGQDALSLLLPTASFLLAAVSVGLAFDAPNRGAVSRLRLPRWLVPTIALLTAVAVLAGGLTAWGQVYMGGDVLPTPQFIVAASLLVAIVGQTSLAIFLSIAMFD